MAAKITMEIARLIRAEFKERMPKVPTRDGTVGRLRNELAAKYGLGRRTVQDILNHTSWKEKDL
jgi:hypothetical protein